MKLNNFPTTTPPLPFPNFPKIRPELPRQYQDIYEEHYQNNRKGSSPATGIATRLEKWMHRKVATDQEENFSLLEIGAGTLNHLPFETGFKSYDIIEPFKSLLPETPNHLGVNQIFKDISQVPLASRYDKIFSIAVLEHVLNLPELVAQSAIRLDPKGIFSAGIPSEGQPLWKLGYTVSTGIEFYLKYKLKYSVIMNYEHINSSNEIEEILNYFFNDVKHKVFGISRALSFYQYFRCINPNLKRASDYLSYVAQNVESKP